MTKKKQPKQTLMLLDGNAIIHRAFHGIPPLTLADGTQVNAVYGFTSTLLNVLEKFQPTHVIASFDLPGGTFRDEMYKEYKANRSATDEDLVPQFALTKEVVRAFTIPIIEKTGVEADDVIGTLARQAEVQGVDVVIVTGDKDTFQLVSNKIKVFTMSRGLSDMLLYDRQKVVDKMGVTPEQIIDYKGLCGDPSDNIPGVKGVGAKTAVTLLTKYDNLDGVYAHIDETTGALNKRLHEHKDLAFLSRKLGTIKTDVDVTLDMHDAQAQTISWSGARDVFQKFSFNSLLKRLGERGQAQGDVVEEELFTFKTIAPAQSKEYLASLVTHDVIAVSLDVYEGTLQGFGVTHQDGAAYIPFREEGIEASKAFFENTQVRKQFFDVKKVLHICANHNIVVAGIERDVLLMAYVARSGMKLDLDDLIFDITGRVVAEVEKKSQMALALRNDADEQKNAAKKAHSIALLAVQFTKEILEISKTQKAPATVSHVLTHMEMPLIRILFEMERAGVLLDQQIFINIAKETDAHVKKLENTIHKDAGENFNVNSTKQLRVILFEKLKIDTTAVKKIKSGFSTASSELEKIRDQHPIIAHIEEYRELFKLKTTYIDVLPLLADEENRIHTTYNQAITPTGRLSSSDPNLQNIPIRTLVGRRMRDAFIAPQGKKLISADYSQIELRCVAHVAHDEKMIAAFRENVDIHTYTAATVLGKPQESITKDERRSAKELNFGLIYGMGAFSFARSAGITMEEATAFIDAYFTQFSGVKKYMEATKISAQEHGYVETLMGRRKNTPEIQSHNFQLRAAGERAAINMPIQGLAAEIMKLAMIDVHEYLSDGYTPDQAQMLLQIHDEVILEVGDEHAERVCQDIQDIMESVYDLAVPLVVDVSSGQNWGEL